MPQTAIAANLNQPFDVHLDLAAQIAFDFIVLADVFTEQAYFGIRQVFDARIGTYAGSAQDGIGARAANAKDIGQSNFNPLVAGEVNAFNTSHSLLSLSLLVFWIVANDIQATFSLDNLALRAALFN
jgi:hypothetical protein